MKEIIFDKNDYKSYKDFYHDLCIKLNKDRFIDWNGEYPDLCYNADLLNEFLWYCHTDNNTYIFKNYDLDKIKNYKNVNDYHYSLVIEVFTEFVKNYPNNKLIFVNKEKIWKK